MHSETSTLQQTDWLSLTARVSRFLLLLLSMPFGLSQRFLHATQVDPWRPNTPHSKDASDREDTTLRPFKLIPSAFFECS